MTLTKRQRRKAVRGWDWDKSPTPPQQPLRSSFTSKRIPRQHFVRRRRTSVPALIGRAHTMGGKRTRRRKRRN
uniref:Uncharacterized protein n=1 Tax=viral metagenome TaxID=1070528 RepID=A0A6C0BAZ8_9ZZZZ